MEIVSKKEDGLRVELPDAEYAAWLAQYGDDPERTRADILNMAGRVYSHRATLREFLAQKITEEQRTQIESMARVRARSHAILSHLIAEGYASYVQRSRRGGMMPDSWSRTVSRASQQIGEDFEVTDIDRDEAMADLGLLRERDRDWSTRVVTGYAAWDIARGGNKK